MADKYLKNNAGLIEEVEGQTTSAGASDAGKIPALGAGGKLDSTLLPPGVGDDASMIEPSEAINAGSFVNIFNDAGTVKIRKADNTNERKADGFIIDAATVGNQVKVYWEGVNSSVSGKTLGALQYLGTAGATVETAPTSTGEIVQRLGKAISATAIATEMAQPIKLA